MLNIFDCSNNNYAPSHRQVSLGPVENDMMASLKEYSRELELQYVIKPEFADVIITNTTYTPEIIKIANEKKIPLVKRMDGVYWTPELVKRNEKLNEAAIQSDAVIFISKYSKDSFHKMYPKNKLNFECVILNNVDENIFYPDKEKSKEIKIWGTSATNWDRKEKRLQEVIEFAKLIDKNNEKLLLIGEAPNTFQSNIIPIGYFDDYKKMANAINFVDAWVNFSYRDPAPKVVIQAIKCGKPVLYAKSGGTPELVKGFGTPIYENAPLCFEKEIPALNMGNVARSYLEFKSKFKKKREIVSKNYIDTLKEYVNVFKNTKHN